MRLTQKHRNKPQLTAKAASPKHDLRLPWLLSIFFFTALLISQQAKSSENEHNYLKLLEKNIWNSSGEAIHQLQQDVTELIQKHPNSSFAHYLLGQLYIRRFVENPYEMQTLRQAAELGQQAIDLREDKDFGYVIAAQVLDMMGYTGNALKLIDPEINSKIKNTWRTHFLLAKFQAAQDGYDLTVERLKKSIAAKNSQREVIIPYILALVESNHEGVDLVAELQVWNRKLANKTIHLNLAISLGEAGEYKAAHREYQKILNRHPKFIEAKINDGIVLYKHLNQEKLAEATLKSVLRDHKDLEGDRQALVKSHLARIHLNQQQYKKSQRYFLEAIAQSPTPIEWIILSHHEYSKRKLYKEFSRLMKEVKQEVPGSGAVYALHGEVLSEKLSLHSEAEMSYQGAILLDPDKSEYYTGLGLTYYRQKDMKRALSQFIQATQVNPNDATARYNEACVLSILGRSQEALGSLQEAINLDPRLQRTALKDRDFKNINGSDQFKSIIGYEATYSNMGLSAKQ